MDISIIAAVGKNNELGKNNNLIWHLKEDLKFFKEMTIGHTIIMGRKTFESLPKMLPSRKHIVLSSSESFPSELEVYKNIKDFLEKYKDADEEIFVIGGSQIYKEFLGFASKMYLTQIDAECRDADVYFPNINMEEWNKEILDEHIENNINYKHVLYRRVL